jgi:hypothetical protein
MGACERQTRPCVYQAQNFAQDVENVAGAAPPMSGIKRIGGGSSHNGAALFRSQLSPKEAHPPRVSLAGNKDDGAIVLSIEGHVDYLDFVGSVDDRGFQHMDGGRRNSLMNQDVLVVILFPLERNPHPLQRFARLRGMREPNFWRITLTIELRCFDGAYRHHSAEDGDSPRVHQGIFNDQPSPDIEKGNESENQDDTGGNGEKNPAAARSGSVGVFGAGHGKLAHAIPGCCGGQLARLPVNYRIRILKEDACGL